MRHILLHIRNLIEIEKALYHHLKHQNCQTYNKINTHETEYRSKKVIIEASNKGADQLSNLRSLNIITPAHELLVLIALAHSLVRAFPAPPRMYKVWKSMKTPTKKLASGWPCMYV